MSFDPKLLQNEADTFLGGKLLYATLTHSVTYSFRHQLRGATDNLYILVHNSTEILLILIFSHSFSTLT